MISDQKNNRNNDNKNTNGNNNNKANDDNSKDNNNGDNSKYNIVIATSLHPSKGYDFCLFELGF